MPVKATLAGKLWGADKCSELSFEDGVLTGIRPVPDTAEEIYIFPGLVDIQVNGYAGIDFNAADLDIDQIRYAVRRLLEAGVTSFCPTFITASGEAIAHSLRTWAHARRDPLIAACVSGFHLEGPWLSPLDGPRGAHPIDHVRQPDLAEFERYYEAAGGFLKLVTLAPELPGAMGLIAAMRKRKIIAAIGHTAATAQQIMAAVDAGAMLSTHIGNGCHSLLPRHPNHIWTQLAEDRLYASLIVDGHHLPAEFVKCALRCKGSSRTILVSDCNTGGGQPPGRYKFGPLDLEVTEDRRVQLPGTEYLAGAATDLLDGVFNFKRFTGASWRDAFATATTNPANLIGIPYGFAIGSSPDICVLRGSSENGRLALTEVWKAGKRQ